MQRLLISDLNLNAVKKALTQLKSNKAFMPLSISALARSRADWLYGINLTRAYTIQGGKVGYQGVLSVGRVQTPILGLVVSRERKIEQFTSKAFFEVTANIQTPDNESFIAKWQPSKACEPYMDSEGRVIVKQLAENVTQRINNQAAYITDVKKKNKTQQPPLPYNLSTLQIDAAKQYAMNAKLVLDVCQALYEKHKLITYPRSDCRYLPNEQFTQAKSILSKLSQAQAPISLAAEKADNTLKSYAWNSKKVTAHHAIIPTEKSPKNITLNNFEKNIYQLICRQYIAQFYPVYLYQHTHVSLTIAGGLFVANANVPTQIGWKVLYQNEHKSMNNKPLDEIQNQQLPPLNQGDVLQCIKANLLTKQTQPPKSFTDATLLAAMTGIARFVEDKQLKTILKETDGLGTEATRASIIELLFKRGFLQRHGKQIKATDAGVGLIDALPKSCATPDMTAQWEVMLNNIADQKISYKAFMDPLNDTLTQLINHASSQLPDSLKGIQSPIKPSYKKRKSTKKKAA